MPIKTRKKTNKKINIDLTEIPRIYIKLWNTYSKLPHSQLIKKEKQLTNKIDTLDFFNYNTVYDLIDFIIKKSNLYKEFILKKEKNTIYIPTNSKKKDACLKEYKKMKELGSGAFGNVILASKKKYKYAIKIQNTNDPEIDYNMEVEIAKKMGELGIGPKIYESYYCKDKEKYILFIVQDYINGGTLGEWIENGKKFTPALKKQLIDKVDKMHKYGFFHNDLHDRNIFIQTYKNKKPEIFIGDFGLSKTSQTFSQGNKNRDLIMINNVLNEDDNYIDDINDFLDILILEDIIINRINIRI